MDLNLLKEHWNRFGKTDPLWSILSWPGKEGGKWEPAEFFRTGLTEIAWILRYAETLHTDFGRQRALDFGCGAGRLTQALSAHFDEVHGVDIAPSMVNLARQYNMFPSRCTYVLNRRNDLKIYPDRTFDFIYTNLVLQHMEPRFSKNYIREFLRLLRVNGLLLFQQPDRPQGGPRSASAPPEKDYRVALKSHAPRPLLALYRGVNRLSLILGLRKPRMELHGIDRQEIQSLVEQNGGKILDVLDQAYLFLNLEGGSLGFLPDLPATARAELGVPLGISLQYAVTMRA